MSELDDLLRFALQLADRADAIALRHFRRELQIDRKPDRTFVTQADRGIEQALREEIERHYPEHGILGEEFGSTAGKDTRWIIDPIDATHSFLRGLPMFATLLGLEREGEMLVGVVSAPAMRERWHAVREGGAWAGRQRIHVSSIARLEESQIFYASRTAFSAVGKAEGFDAVVEAAWRDRGFGDFWGYALVAEGRGEAMIEPELYPWDLAAPLILVEEAGGRLTDFKGARTHSGGNAVASNGVVHEEVLRRLNGV